MTKSMILNEPAKFITCVKDEVNRFYDASHIGIEMQDITLQYNVLHKGFYLGLLDSSDTEIARVGFLKDKQTNLVSSAALVLNDLKNILQLKNISRNQFNTCKIYCVAIQDCVYIADPLNWDVKTNGILFKWGQKYQGLYLPYQIARMKAHKIEIMDRLCSLECGLISNLWKLPEGLVYRLICSTIES